MSKTAHGLKNLLAFIKGGQKVEVVKCEECGGLYDKSVLSPVVCNENGEEIHICGDCLKKLDFEECEFCRKFYPKYALEDIGAVYVEYACESCIEEMELAQCGYCGEWYHYKELDENGNCHDCAKHIKTA